MTSTQVVETSVANNSSFQNYSHPDNHTIRTTDTPGFKPFTMKVVMVAKTEKQTKPDRDEKVIVMKLSEELKEEVLQNYMQVFTGLGHLEKPYHIEVDPTVTPVINLPRTVPAVLQDRVKEELDDMEK